MKLRNAASDGIRPKILALRRWHRACARWAGWGVRSPQGGIKSLRIQAAFPSRHYDCGDRIADEVGDRSAFAHEAVDAEDQRQEPGGSRLFIARRKDGLTVFDVDSGKVVGQVGNSAGANGPLLLPQFNRGYTAMTDGSLLSFDLKTPEVIDRVKLADDGGVNGVIFDPATGRIHAVVGARPQQSAWYTLDAATGKLLGTKTFPFRKMDDPAPNGRGHLFAPARYDNILLKLNSTTLAEEGRWQIDCVQVVAVEFQHETDRLLIGCRGDEPVFIALDATTGRQVARIPIGKRIDGMAVDEMRHRILTSNGGDATISVIGQEGADSYKLLGNIQTRPQARVMQIDRRTGRLFTVTRVRRRG